MKRPSLHCLSAFAALLPLLAHDALSQEGKLYVTAYDTVNFSMRFTRVNAEEFIIAKAESPAPRRAQITKLEIKQFRNAIQKIFGIQHDTLTTVSYDLLNQINLDMARSEIAQRFEDERLRENVAIGLLSFRSQQRKAPLLIKPRKEEIKPPEKDSLAATTKVAEAVQSIRKEKWQAARSAKENVPAPLSELDSFRIVQAGGNFYRIETAQNSFMVNSIEIAFEDGTMKDILIKGKLLYENIDIFFQNAYSISISTPRHIARLNTRGNNLLHFQGDKFEYYVDLADVIKYDRIVAMGSGHYVPQNGIIKLDSAAQKPMTLVKNPFFDNFDVRLYTDVTGLQKENPNGLIQTEGRYNILLNTKPLNPYSRGLRNILLFNKIAPFVTFSKIENKLNDLPLDTIVVNAAVLNQTTAVDFLRFANFNIGIDLNILSWVGSHTKFKLNGMIGLYRTSVDSASRAVPGRGQITSATFEPRSVLAWHWTPALSVQMIDGDKLDFDLSAGLTFLRLFDSNITLRDDRTVKRYQMNLNIHPNPNQQDKSIFFRSTFYYTNKTNHNLSLQLGYATPISKLF